MPRYRFRFYNSKKPFTIYISEQDDVKSINLFLEYTQDVKLERHTPNHFCEFLKNKGYHARIIEE